MKIIFNQYFNSEFLNQCITNLFNFLLELTQNMFHVCDVQCKLNNIRDVIFELRERGEIKKDFFSKGKPFYL